MPKRKPLAFLLLWPMILAFFVSFAHGAPEEKDGKAAVVDGVVISKEQLEEGLRMLKTIAASSGRRMTAEEESRKKGEILEALIVDQLLYAEAERRKIKVTNDELDKAIKEFMKRYRLKSEEELKRFLQESRLTYDQLRVDTKKQLMRSKLLAETVAPKAKVSEAEARKFYQENQKKLFVKPRTVKLSQILLPVPSTMDAGEKKELLSRMQSIRKEILGGKSFAEMAKRYSRDASAPAGGDLGFVTAKDLAEPLAKAAFSLKKGQVSEVLETDAGLHLIVVTDFEEEKNISFEEVKLDITRFLEQQKWAAEMEKYIKELTSKAKIKKFI